MEYRKLGNSDIEVSRLCFGSLTLGPLCAGLPIEQGRDLILAAVQRGINFIDTAQQYKTYPYIRAALDVLAKQAADIRPVVIATKTYAASDIEASRALEDARIALGRDHLDIFLLHEVRSCEDFAERAGAWQMLQDAKTNGYIRAVGISTHSAAFAAWAAEQECIDIIFALVNIGGIGINDGGRDDMLHALALAKAKGKGVYGMKALAGGGLMHQAREALAWAYQRPELDAVAVGCRDMAELITDIGWLEGQDPPEARRIRRIDRHMVFDKEPRCHGCGLCVERCPHKALYLAEDGLVAWDKSRCIYCGYCIAACPWFCISFC